MSEGYAAPDGAMPRIPIIDSALLANGEVERILLSKQKDVTLICTSDATIRYASPSLKPVFGYSDQDILGKSFAEFVHPDDLAAVAKDWQRFSEGSERDPVQFRARHKNGSWGWYEAHSSHLEDSRFPDCSCINIHEVAHLRRIQERVTAAEEMAKIGSWRWIINDGHPEWSSSMYRLLGYEPSEGVVDLDWAFNLIHPGDQEQFRNQIISCLERPNSFTITTRMRDRDGVYKSVIQYCYAERDVNEAVIAMIGICQDITAQVDAERALRKSERDYRLLADEASDMILRVRDGGVCTFASPASFGILGYRPEEMVGTTVLRYAHKTDYTAIQSVYKKAREGLEAQRVVFKGRHKDGSAVWLEAGVRALTDSDGKFSELVIVARDVTERRNHEEELRAAREKAEAANVTKSKFLANMSHELRTPLNAVIGFSDIMQEEMFGPLGSEQYADYVKLIHESGQFLLDLINDILDMSKIEAGKYELFMEELNLESMIDGCLRIVETRAKTGNIALISRVPSDLPSIPADERALKQILLNLLSNAVKFTGDGGEVHVLVTKLDNSIRVSVSDSGCGIPADAIPRLAQPFEQAISEAVLAQNGTGLGLALVKSFVELHGGKLTIESVEGEGTTVAFTLPLDSEFQKKSA